MRLRIKSPYIRLKNSAREKGINLRIKRLRVDNDLSQKQVADYLVCDQSLYSKYERKKRPVPLEIIVKLAEFYHTSVDYLVGLTDIQKPYERSSNLNV